MKITFQISSAYEYIFFYLFPSGTETIEREENELTGLWFPVKVEAVDCRTKAVNDKSLRRDVKQQSSPHHALQRPPPVSPCFPSLYHAHPLLPRLPFPSSSLTTPCRPSSPTSHQQAACWVGGKMRNEGSVWTSQVKSFLFSCLSSSWKETKRRQKLE